MERAEVEVARSVTRWEEWNGKPIQIEAAGAETERRWAREGNGLTVTMPVMVRGVRLQQQRRQWRHELQSDRARHLGWEEVGSYFLRLYTAPVGW